MALNMADLVEHVGDSLAERVSLIFGDRQVTYAELEDEANRLAHHLAAQGVGPGDHVGLYARNSVETVETLLATIKLRAASININYRYLRDELAYHLRDADLSALVHDQDLAPVADAVAPSGLPRVAIGADVAEALSFDQALSAASGARDFSPRSPDDIFIIYTGGTTGHPQAAMCRPGARDARVVAPRDILPPAPRRLRLHPRRATGRRVGAVPPGRRGRRHRP